MKKPNKRIKLVKLTQPTDAEQDDSSFASDLSINKPSVTLTCKSSACAKPLFGAVSFCPFCGADQSKCEPPDIAAPEEVVLDIPKSTSNVEQKFEDQHIQDETCDFHSKFDGDREECKQDEDPACGKKVEQKYEIPGTQDGLSPDSSPDANRELTKQLKGASGFNRPPTIGSHVWEIWHKLEGGLGLRVSLSIILVIAVIVLLSIGYEKWWHTEQTEKSLSGPGSVTIHTNGQGHTSAGKTANNPAELTEKQHGPKPELIEADRLISKRRFKDAAAIYEKLDSHEDGAVSKEGREGLRKILNEVNNSYKRDVKAAEEIFSYLSKSKNEGVKKEASQGLIMLGAEHRKIGEISKSSGDCVKAKKEFEKAVQLNPDDEATRLALKSIGSAVGTLSIVCEPWAYVHIDNAPKGITPMAGIELLCGQHTVRLIHPNHPQFSERTKVVNILVGKQTVLKISGSNIQEKTRHGVGNE